ncbi:GtrA family protein [Leifsonia naganoensis]|uniref:Putative flippase GtrA n=1 Tax=Leifsonia naganoensis TaxID=150025 RepID=A0A853DRN0_9MICO|nr:GtrA family protein [Leifsonia naganoensis]NYK08750.1 putative flippase GtrA [Leifsonia naganoensis]
MTNENPPAAHKARLLPQLIKFGAVGAVGFVVNLAVFNGLMLTVLAGVPHKTLIATAIATLVAIGTNWVGNRYWAFSQNRQANTAREGAEFFIVSLAGMAIPLLCVWVSHYLLGFTSLLADNIANNVVGLALGMVFRFGFYRWWVFSPDRAERRTKRRAVPAAQTPEPAVLTGSTLAGSPDGRLVGD